MTGDIEKKFNDVKDSLKMPGMNDRLEKIVQDTKASAGMTDMRPLSEDELDMVAGGIVKRKPKNMYAEADGRVRGSVTPKGGLTC